MKRTLLLALTLVGCDSDGGESTPATTSATTATTASTTDPGSTGAAMTSSTTDDPSVGTTSTGSTTDDDDEDSGPVIFDVGTLSDAGEIGDGDCNDGTVMLPATIRDFSSTHPDFEAFWGADASLELVEATLGADGLPVYNPSAPLPPGGSSPTQITSADTFAQWYADVADVNVTESFEFELVETPPGSGLFVFSDSTFFPIDDAGWNGAPGPNNETFPDALGDQHNFHFTTEIHTVFEYEAGQVFTFIGDDDLWVFIDGGRVIDLGGLHGELMGSVDLDTLGLTEGEEYTMDIFHAERRHDGSHFRIETSIQCFSTPAG